MRESSGNLVVSDCIVAWHFVWCWFDAGVVLCWCRRVACVVCVEC